MARIVITSDDGKLTHSERVIPSDLDSEHFRRCLIERLQWAVKDAHWRGDRATGARRSCSRESRPRPVSIEVGRGATHQLAATAQSRPPAAAS
jgi:hypothetical protein